MNEVVPDVFTWSRLSPAHGYDFNGYLVRDAAGNLCIDPVEPDDRVLDAIARLGVAKILLTNRNHSRAANLLREQVMDDPARLRRSVIELAKLDFDTLLVGDGTPILAEAKARLLELVQTFGP